MTEFSPNQNVVSASVERNRYGLLDVVFVCEGVPEWPTALKNGQNHNGLPLTVKDNPIVAFRGGPQTVKCPLQYSYHRSNRQVQSWTCRSILFSDGSAYSQNEEARDILPKDKMRVFSARVYDVGDPDLGIKCVEFNGVGLIGGKPIWPTALAEGKSLEDSPVDAFWGGQDSIKIPHTADYSDADLGEVWTTKTYVNSDGSALDLSEGKIALKSYSKMISFPFPGRVDVTIDKGPVMTPPITYSVPATVSTFLLNQSQAQEPQLPPYQVKNWCSFGATYVLEDSDSSIPKSEGGAARGYLSGDSWVGIGGEYKGAPVKSVVTWCNSAPTHNAFLNAIAEGRIVERSIVPVFIDVEGNTFYVLRETYLEFSPNDLEV